MGWARQQGRASGQGPGRGSGASGLERLTAGRGQGNGGWGRTLGDAQAAVLGIWQKRMCAPTEGRQETSVSCILRPRFGSCPCKQVSV